MFIRHGYPVTLPSGHILFMDNERVINGCSIFGPLFDDDIEFCEFVGHTYGRNAKILEIGTFMGLSSFSMLKGSEFSSEMYCIDSWEYTGMITEPDKAIDIFSFFLQCVDSVGSRFIHPIRMKSKYAFPILKDGFFDVVFIDGDHSYEGACLDIKNSLLKVKNGGIICGHDYHMDGVKQAIDENLGEVERHAKIMWLKKIYK
jgi:hypothetical protein